MIDGPNTIGLRLPRRQTRAGPELRAGASYRDDTTAVISVDAWREMGRMMSPSGR